MEDCFSDCPRQQIRKVFKYIFMRVIPIHFPLTIRVLFQLFCSITRVQLAVLVKGTNQIPGRSQATSHSLALQGWLWLVLSFQPQAHKFLQTLGKPPLHHPSLSPCLTLKTQRYNLPRKHRTKWRSGAVHKAFPPNVGAAVPT